MNRFAVPETPLPLHAPSKLLSAVVVPSKVNVKWTALLVGVPEGVARRLISCPADTLAVFTVSVQVVALAPEMVQVGPVATASTMKAKA